MAVETKAQAMDLVASVFARAGARLAAEGHVAPEPAKDAGVLEPAKESVLPGAGAVAA